MSTATRIDTSVLEGTEVQIRAASPLGAIHMSPHERRQAERDLRTAEQLVDLIFAAAAGWQAFVRRLRSVRDVRVVQ